MTLNELFARFDKLAAVSGGAEGTLGRPGALLTCLCPSGEPLPAHQDPGGLLLLCVRAARGARGPRSLLCGDGCRHDRGHLVSGAEPGAVPVPSATSA